MTGNHKLWQRQNFEMWGQQSGSKGDEKPQSTKSEQARSSRDKGISNVQRKKQRERQNNLVAQLDAALPPSACRRVTVNGAGARALGTQGRGLHDVLRNTIACVAELRPRLAPKFKQEENVQDFLDMAPAPAVHLDEDLMREGLLSSHSLAVIELVMPGFVMYELSPAALQLFGHMPYIKFKGQSLQNGLVHPDDMNTLHNLFKDAQRNEKEQKENTAHGNTGLNTSAPPDSDASRNPGVGRGRIRMLRVQHVPTP
jgi:hypothetical protein